MATGAENQPSEKPSTGSHLELFSRVVGTALVLTYGLGFLILSLHQARFGIAQFNPFRARVFAAGFIFVCLTALPAAALHYGSTYYRGLEPIMKVGDARIEKYRKAVLFLGFYFAAFVMAVASSFLFAPSKLGAAAHWLFVVQIVFFIVAVLFFFASYSLIAKRLSEHPKACLFLALFAILVMGVALEFYGLRSYSLLTTWYFLVGVFTFLVRDNENPLKEALDWRNWLFAAILVGFYASSIYGGIQAKYGGGAPTPAVLYLSKPSAWFDSNVVSVQLLDETEEGYFILAPSSDKALFIPRSNVTALYFGSLNEVPKKK